MIGMMLMGKTPDMSCYEVLSTMPDEMDPKTWVGCYFDREIHGDKVMQLSMDIRNLAKTDIAQRARGRFRVEEEVVEETAGAKEGADEDGMAEEGDADEDMDDYGD